MPALEEKANELRSTPWSDGANAPGESGIMLATFPPTGGETALHLEY